MFAVYLAIFNALTQWYRDYRTSNWPTVKGEVQSCQISFSRVVVTYTYKIDNQRFSGIHERACSGGSAGEYAKLFAPKWSVIVRYNGAWPERSFVIDDDQTAPPAWATRYRDVAD